MFIGAVVKELVRPSSGPIVAAALEAKGVVIAETAEALVKAEPLHRARELRRLAAPAFTALLQQL